MGMAVLIFGGEYGCEFFYPSLILFFLLEFVPPFSFPPFLFFLFDAPGD